MAQTIVALYEDLGKAKKVVAALTDAGHEHKDISFASPDPEGRHAEMLAASGDDEDEGDGDATAEGAMVGGAIGAIAGLLFGLSAFTIPGLGPLVVAGPLYTAVFGAGAGGLGGGLVGAMVDAGVPQREASFYREGIRRGNTMIAVKVDDENKARALHILNAHGPLDIESAAESWRATGWEGPDDTPDQFVPSEEDEKEAAENKYATGAMGEDLTGPNASRDRPPLPTADED
jgi:hypothetical protein